MPDVLKRHKYAVNRILIPAARILSPEFNAAYLYFTGSHIELMRNLLDYANRETTFVDEYHEGYYYSPNDSDWDSLRAIVAELEEILMLVHMGYYNAYVCVRDKKTPGTGGGTFTLGAWRTRDVNDEQADAGNICSIASNQITLEPGTYRCVISCPALAVNNHQARLQNISDTLTLLYGSCEYARASTVVQSRSFVVGRFTLANAKTLEIQHRCTATTPTNGFGNTCSFTEEIYTLAEFWREN